MMGRQLIFTIKGVEWKRKFDEAADSSRKLVIVERAKR